jgi:broad specificity phosphatase PhoE
MKNFTLVLIIVLFVSCSTTNYYIVRHAEKETQKSNMSSDVPLSSTGKERAEALKNVLQNQKIKNIFSTNTIRTKTTAKPTSDATGVDIDPYDPRDTGFVARLKTIQTGNSLIVGHSNTVDDIVNKLTGQNLLQDLPDSQYGDLFIVKKKRNKYSFSKARFGN